MRYIVPTCYRSIISEIPYIVFYLTISPTRIEVYRISRNTRSETREKINTFYFIFEDDSFFDRSFFSIFCYHSQYDSFFSSCSILILLDRVTFCRRFSLTEVEDKLLYFSVFTLRLRSIYSYETGDIIRSHSDIYTWHETLSLDIYDHCILYCLGFSLPTRRYFFESIDSFYRIA